MMSKKWSRLLACSLLFAAISGCMPVAGDNSLITDPIRQAREFVGKDRWETGGFTIGSQTANNVFIILPQHPSEVHRYAAKELAEHVRKSANVSLAILKEEQQIPPGQRIYIGPVRALQENKIATVPHGFKSSIIVSPEQLSRSGTTKVRQAKEVSEKLWLGTPGASNKVELIIDLGEKRTVDAISIRNRADTLTSYNIHRIVVEIGAADDGQSFNQKVAEGVPEVGETVADRERFLPLNSGKAIQARYFRLSVLSNFFSPLGQGTNGNLVQWQSIGFSEPRSRNLPTDLINLSQLPKNAFLIKTIGDALFLAGNDESGSPLNDGVSAGTLFAVYEWLERQVGVRWAWPGELGTHVPVKAKLTSGVLDVLKQPPLLHSRLRRTLGRPVFTPGSGGYSLQQQAKVIEEENIWYRRNRFARGISLEYGHAYEDYWKRFGQTNPEFFNLLPDGTRRSDPHSWGKGAPHLTSMAVANEGFARQVVKDWQANRSANKPWINGWENDSEAKDISPEALAWDVRDPALGERWEQRVENARREFNTGKDGWAKELGSLSDRYAKFYLRLQEFGRETDPNATVIGGAYANYAEPPLQTKLNKNIVVGVVPEYGWPIVDYYTKSFERQWLGWNKAGATLYLRPNYTLYGHNLPLVTARRWAHDFQLAYRNGMIATDYDSLTSMWATQGISLYVLTRLHWRPEMAVDAIMQEYYDLFGSASGDIKRYTEFWEQKTEAGAVELVKQKIGTDIRGYGQVQLFGHWPEAHLNAGKIFDETTFREAAEILDAAVKSAQGNELVLKRIAFLRDGLEDARLVTQASAVFDKAKNGETTLPMARAIAQVDEHRAKLVRDNPNAINLDLVIWMENRKWNRAFSGLIQNGEIIERLPLDWQFRWDEQNRGLAQRWFTASQTTDWQPIRVDAAWEKQAVGKAWAARNGKNYDGIAWYKLQFEVDTKWKDKALSLLFEAVDESALIYLNGQQIGERKFEKANDWQEPFLIKLGTQVKYGSPNELVVRVADQAGNGGIWKPVWLVHKP